VQSALAYTVALAGMFATFAPVVMIQTSWRIFVAFSLALVVLVAAARSRRVRAQAVHAFLLFLAASLLQLVPVLVHSLMARGYLATKMFTNTEVNQAIAVDQPLAVCGLAVLVLGTPLVFLTFEALMEAVKGAYLDWAVLRWIRGRLDPS
jgi:hypothetical protein